MTTTANSTTAAAKTRPVFYTRDNAGVKVALWKNTRSTKDNAPVLIGTIDGVQVAGFVRQGPTNKFIQFSGLTKLENGNYTNIATGNVVAGNLGYPKLVVKMGETEVWADTTKEGSNEFLATMGLNIEKMLAKQETAKAARNSEKAAA